MRIQSLSFMMVLTLAAAANAATIADGWSQRFEESGSGPFDFIAVEMVSAGDAFRSPALHGFNKSGWALADQNDPIFPSRAYAVGPIVDKLQFDVAFAGPRSDPFDLHLFSYLGEQVQTAAVAHWNGESFSITNYNDGVGFPRDLPARTSFAPTPTALGAGLALFGAMLVARRPQRPQRPQRQA